MALKVEMAREIIGVGERMNKRSSNQNFRGVGDLGLLAASIHPMLLALLDSMGKLQDNFHCERGSGSPTRPFEGRGILRHFFRILPNEQRLYK